MFCTKCGTNVGEGNFCPTCGNKMPKVVPAAPAVENVAPVVEEAVAPVVEEAAAPVVEEAVAPVVEAAAPVVEQVAPAVEQVAPVVEQVVEQATPVVESVNVAPVEMAAPIEMAKPVDITPVAPVEPVNVTPVESVNVAPVAPAEPPKPKMQQVVTSSSVMGNNMNANGYYNEPSNIVKKPKKWPKVLAIVAVLAVIIGAAGYFAWPMIEGIISPKAKAISALKTVSSTAEDSINDAFENGINFEVADTKVESTLSIKKIVFDGVDYTNAIKEKNLFSVNEFVTKDGKAAGMVGIGSSSKPIVSFRYYTDGNRMYFKIPELTSQAFYVPIETNMSASGSISGLGAGSVSLTPEMLQQYSKYVKAASSDVFKALNTLIEDMDYEYVGKDTYKSVNGDVKVSIFNVKITNEVFKKFVKELVSNVLDDKELNTFTGLLALTGYNKDSLLAEIDKLTLIPAEYDGIKFQMYVNDNKKVAKLIFDAKDYGYKGEQPINVGIAFVGKKNPTDFVQVDFEVGGATGKLAMGVEDEKLTVEASFMPNDQTKYPGEFISFKVNGTANANSFKLDEISLQGKMRGESIDIQASADAKTSSLATLSYDASDFKGAVNPENVSDSKRMSIMEDVQDNMDIIDKILSPSLKNDLFGDSLD